MATTAHPRGAALTDEDAFLRAILANPEDDAPRLVYADWLDERGDPASEMKAAFIRDAARLPTAGGRASKALSRRLCDAARELDEDFLAVVSKPPIEACPRKYRFRCPRQWDKLQATEAVRARYCPACRKCVHYCSSLADANDLAWQRQPVVISSGVTRRTADLYPHRVGPGRPVPDLSLRDVLEEFEIDRASG